MKYLLLIYGNDEIWGSYAPAEFDELIAQDARFQRELRESGELVAVEGLAERTEAAFVTGRSGVPVVTDGPYLEAKEYLASFYVVDVAGRERAVELAGRYPAVDRAVVEVWPLLGEPGA